MGGMELQGYYCLSNKANYVLLRLIAMDENTMKDMIASAIIFPELHDAEEAGVKSELKGSEEWKTKVYVVEIAHGKNFVALF